MNLIPANAFARKDITQFQMAMFVKYMAENYDDSRALHRICRFYGTVGEPYLRHLGLEWRDFECPTYTKIYLHLMLNF